MLAPVLVVAGPAMAKEARLTLPGGTLGEALEALGRARGVSVAVAVPALWQRRVPAIDGRMSVETALARLAAASGAELERTGIASWRLTERPRQPVQRMARRGGRDPAPPAEPADVIVTASKRDTPARWFGGSVLRLDGDELTINGAGGTDRIAARTTSLGSTHLGQGRNKLFIRGLADSSFTGPAQAIVGQYLGDLRLGYSGADPSLQLYDVRSVEILEGPQGTLYGSGALGGIIRMVPVAPDPARAAGSASLGVSATTDGAPGADAAAMLNVPVTGDVALRAVGYAQRHGGYIDKPLRGQDDVNRVDLAGGRAALGWNAGGGWTVELGAAGQRIRGRDSQYVDEDAPPLTNLRRLREGYDTGFALGHLTISGKIGDVSVRSATGVVGQNVTERFDATTPLEGPSLLVQRQRTRLLTSETRAWRSSRDGSGWLVGASLVRHRRTLDRRFVPPLGAFLPARSGETVGEHTVYGEGALALLPGLVASGGLRWTDVELRDRGPVLAPDDDRTRREQVLLPSGAVTARVGGASLYLRYQQGFRPGGLTVDADAVRRFRSDRLYAAEAGLRLSDDGGRWTARAAVSRSRWHGIQANFLDPYGLPATANLGNGTIWSAEAAIGWRPTPEWHLDLAATVNWSRITAFSAEARVAVEAVPQSFAAVRSLRAARLGGDVPNVADGTARAGAGWRRDVAGLGLFTADAWVRYVGRSRLGVGPYLGDEQGGYVDSAAALRLTRGSWGVTLGVENVADTRGNRFALGTPFRLGLGQATPLRPRTFRIGVDASF